MESSGGASIPDMEMTGYSPQQAYDILTAQGEVGRDFYLQNMIPQDMLFPLIYAMLFASMLTMLSQRLFPTDHALQYIGLLGLCAGLADWAENFCLLGLLLNYPQRLDALASVASLFTVLKASLSMLNMVLIILGLGWLLAKSISSRNSAKVSTHGQ
jgi:hypothetical protein